MGSCAESLDTLYVEGHNALQVTDLQKYFEANSSLVVLKTERCPAARDELMCYRLSNDEISTDDIH